MFQPLLRRLCRSESLVAEVSRRLAKSTHVYRAFDQAAESDEGRIHGHYVVRAGRPLGMAIALVKGNRLVQAVFPYMSSEDASVVRDIMAAHYEVGLLHKAQRMPALEKPAPTDLMPGGRFSYRNDARPTSSIARDESGRSARSVIGPSSRRVVRNLHESVGQITREVKDRVGHPGAAVCGKNGCSSRLDFHSYTDFASGVSRVMESCPTCKTTSPVLSRRASAFDSQSADRANRNFDVWKFADSVSASRETSRRKA